MTLPLQPDPQRPRRRWLVPAGVLIAVLSLGAIQDGRGQPDRLLGNRGGVHERFLPAVSRLIDTAETRIWLMVYVLRFSSDQQQDPVAHLVDGLRRAAARGCDVRVVLDRSDQTATWPGPDNSEPAARLRALGLQVIEDDLATRTHAKALLIDDLSIVGSHNWTRSALNSNRELSLLSSDPAVALALTARFRAIPGF